MQALQSYTVVWNTNEFRRMVVRYRPWRFVAQRRIRDHRGPGVKLLFRPTFTPAAARVTFDWTATPNWFRLKSLPLTETPACLLLASTAHSLPSMRRSPPAFSSFTRFRPSSVSNASSFNSRPRSFSSPVPAIVHRLRLFLNLIRDHGASLQTAPNVFPPSPFFLSSACERSKN